MELIFLFALNFTFKKQLQINLEREKKKNNLLRDFCRMKQKAKEQKSEFKTNHFRFLFHLLTFKGSFFFYRKKNSFSVIHFYVAYKRT